MREMMFNVKTGKYEKTFIVSWLGNSAGPFFEDKANRFADAVSKEYSIDRAEVTIK